MKHEKCSYNSVFINVQCRWVRQKQDVEYVQAGSGIRFFSPMPTSIYLFGVSNENT